MHRPPHSDKEQLAPENNPALWGMEKPDLNALLGFGMEQPPPVPPRTYSRQSGHSAYQSNNINYGGHLDGFKPVSQTNNIRLSQPWMSGVESQSRKTSQRNSSELISFSPPSQGKLNAFTFMPNSSSFDDLEGLDFTRQSAQNRTLPDTTTKTEATKMYPDISAAFRGLNQPVPINPPAGGWSTMPVNQSSNRHSMPVPYGWDQTLTQQAGCIGQGTMSVPSTPVAGQYYPNNLPPAFGAYNFGSNYPVQNTNSLQNFNQQQDPFTAGGYTKPNSNAGASKDLTDSSKLGQSDGEGFNFVPNLDFDSWTDSDAFSVDQATIPNHGLTLDTKVKTHKRQSSDLIQLGFDGLYSADEKEYFSLEYFDPLHLKGRSVSISSPSSTAGYFFAKPPEDTNVVSKERDAWVTFDEDTNSVFGDRSSEDVTDTMRITQDIKQDLRQQPTSVSDGDSRTPSKLRKKLFVDEESDCFCQMVAALKNGYKSTDIKTNLGFIVSPMCEKQQDNLSVMITVHSDFVTEPCKFTSDVHSLVEHVISEVLFSHLSVSLPRHMIDALKTVDFILKVYDRSEYLLNEFPLSKYSYTHDCLKMDQDLCFYIMRRQDVALPFIRTIDDDNQQLYFPQDHAQETDVSRESLEILIDTFYKESERISDLVLRDELNQVQFQNLKQAVKAVCNILSKIETIDIAKCLTRVESILNKMKTSMPSKSHTLEHVEGGYGTLQRGSMKVSLIQELEEALEALQTSIKQLVRIYCQAFHTDFKLDSRIDQPWDPQDVTGFNETFIVQICTVHRIPSEWKERFDEYRVDCALYHGIRNLHGNPVVSSTCASICTSGLVPLIIWDEWLTFNDISLCILPRETRLCITLVGMRTQQTGNTNSSETQKEAVALGGVTIQLFNRRGYMTQGSQLVPFQMNAAADPITPFCSTLQTDSALLQLNLPDFGKQILFSEPLRVQDSPKKTMNDLAPTVRDEVKEVLKKDCVSSCTADQLEVLWLHRHYLYDHPGLLPWILQAATHWDWAGLPEIYAIVEKWTTLLPMQSLELLLPQYPDLKVRSFAVDCLRKMPTDDLIDFIPQLIQALKYESYHSSPLARLLLEQSCKSVRFAHQFFWLLKGATQDSLYKRRYELMFVALVSVAGESLYQEFKKQEEIVKVITLTAEKVQKAAKDKEGILRSQLLLLHDKFQEKHHVLLPHNPGYEVSGIELNSCSFFTSNAFPIKLVFKNRTENAGPVYAMMKVGDDLRQDMMMMQFIRIMDRLWLKEGLDLKMITFSCLPTGPRRGFIEIITEADTLRRIQVSSGVTGSFKDRPIKDWLQKHNPTELDYKKAVENFTRSCAGYCVATYILGVCDRHNDNIMLKQTGHLFHIDFNKILGDAQMFGNFKRDRVPFVLTSDMAYVINDGDRQTDKFQHFIDMCCQAFNILRKHANLFINLLSLMLRSGIPGITDKGVEFVQLALLPERSETQAAMEFTKMIQESLSARSTQINFFIHNLAQMKFSSHNEGALLSFIPKVYSQQTDGKISHVEVYGFQKRYTPEKHYIYTLKIERENLKVPTYVFRIYSEFVEFRNKLAAMFPLVNWPQLQGRVLLGRSHVKAVAETRKAEIEKFMKDLFDNTPEVSHSEIVYTFFHPLLRDEQEAQKDNIGLQKLRENPILIQSKDGQVKLSLEYIKDTLHIMVMHAKDLPVHGSELPSPYVKTYLLPDPEKQTKRKTKIIKDTTHPTYNEVIEYKLPLETLRQKMLQVTIWNHDVLKENDLLGAVYIKLNDLDNNKTISNWYKLDKIQVLSPTPKSLKSDHSQTSPNKENVDANIERNTEVTTPGKNRSTDQEVENPSFSPEQKKRMEDNRLIAVAKLMEKQTCGLYRDVGLSWLKALEGEFKKPYFQKLGKFVEAERQKNKVFPPAENVFSWTRACSVENVKVVVLGQDPYHGPNQAHGLSFSVLPGIPAPPSLLNMYKELEKDIDGFKKPNHGYLQGWAKQGVLMLNAVMTVRAHQANSHRDQGWEKFTDATLSYLNKNRQGLVFILWGSYAQKKGAQIDKKKHCVLKGVHPSPLSAHRGFFGCKHFSKCNEYLREHGKTEIDWTHLPCE